MRIFTIGFTQKRAEQFFSMLDRPDIARIVDIRLKNNSQLAGFTRGADMPFLLERLVGKGYVHEPRLAPSDEILTAYRNNKIDWPEYERRFLVLLDERRGLGDAHAVDVGDDRQRDGKKQHHLTGAGGAAS